MVLASLLASCQPGPDAAGTLAPVPSFQLDAMSPEARTALGTARDAVIQNPEDAETNGALAMALHAYDLREESVDGYLRAAALAPADWRWPYYLGSVLAELGRHAEAEGHFRSAAAMKPDSSAAHFRLGEALLAEGRAAESKDAFAEAIDLEPSSAAGHYGLGRAWDASGDRARAMSSYLRAIELEPDAGAVRYALAMLYQTVGRSSDAKRQLDIAGPERREPALSDPLIAAVHALRADRQRHLQEGLRLEAEGLLEEAVQAYEEAVEADRNYAQPHINLVSAYGKLERFEDASRHYDRALELAPDSEELHVNRGTLLARTGRLAEAAASFRRALEINPHSGSTHADLAWVLEQAGDRDTALDHYRLALDYAPAHREANFRIARQMIRDNRVEEAISHLERTLEPVDERTPTYLYGLADAYVRTDEPRKAAQALRQALELAAELGQSELAHNLERDLQALEAAAQR